MKPGLMLLALMASAAGATPTTRDAQDEWWTPGFNARVRIEACGATQSVAASSGSGTTSRKASLTGHCWSASR